MIPEELYKRRRAHNNTPTSVMLILTNCIVLAVLLSMFSLCNTINNFFWVALAVLALYNAYDIRRNREEYQRLNIIIYAVSIILMAFLLYYMSTHSTNC